MFTNPGLGHISKIYLWKTVVIVQNYERNLQKVCVFAVCVSSTQAEEEEDSEGKQTATQGKWHQPSGRCNGYARLCSFFLRQFCLKMGLSGVLRCCCLVAEERKCTTEGIKSGSKSP